MNDFLIVYDVASLCFLIGVMVGVLLYPTIDTKALENRSIYSYKVPIKNNIDPQKFVVNIDPVKNNKKHG